MRTPKPRNLIAMSNAWDDPTAFAHELNQYYSQLAASGHTTPARDITTAAHTAETKETHQ